MNILNLIRWKNLVMIAMAQLLIKYAFLDAFGIKTCLDGLGISLLVFSTLCIAAAGNIINDIYDIEADLVNKPSKVIVGKTISEKNAYNLFFALNVIGVCIGFYISNLVGRSPFFSVFVIISALLYIYASYLKQFILIGNIIISVLVALSILIVGVFEIIPLITPENRALQLFYFEIIFNYAFFAFMINLIREITKDIEDFEGDSKVGIKTLPIALGIERTKIILFGLSLIPLLIVVLYVVNTVYSNIIAAIYFLALIIGPMIYTSIKIFSANTKGDFTHISNMLKVIMVFGTLSLLLYKYVII